MHWLQVTNLLLSLIFFLLIKLSQQRAQTLIEVVVRLASRRSKEASVHVNQIADLPHSSIVFSEVSLGYQTVQQAIELLWQFKVFVLHREIVSNDVIKAEIALQVIEAYSFELLREKKNDAKKSLRVIIRHRKMALTFQAPQVALRYVCCRERQVAAQSGLSNVWHQSNEPQSRVRSRHLVLNGTYCVFDLAWWIILVQVDHLEIFRLAFRKLFDSIADLALEHIH